MDLFRLLRALSFVQQTLGLLVEVLKKRFQSYIKIVLPVLKNIMKSSLGAVTNKQPNPYNEEAMIPYWKETYYSLVMLEKILCQFPELYLEKDFEVLLVIPITIKLLSINKPFPLLISK